MKATLNMTFFNPLLGYAQKPFIDLTQEDREDDPLDNYEGKWKNLHFAKTGESGLSHYTYDSEEEALASTEKILNTNSRDQICCFYTMNELNIVFRNTTGILLKNLGFLEYSHTIQVPYGEDIHD